MRDFRSQWVHLLFLSFVLLGIGCRQASQSSRWTGHLLSETAYFGAKDSQVQQEDQVPITRFQVQNGTRLNDYYGTLARFGKGPILVDRRRRAIRFRPDYADARVTLSGTMMEAGAIKSPDGNAYLGFTPGHSTGGGWVLRVDERRLRAFIAGE